MTSGPADRQPLTGDQDAGGLRELKLFVPDELFRAWQRCSWVIVAETGRTRTEIMQEMVRDFLVKHGC
jgi:hypothetical protein